MNVAFNTYQAFISNFTANQAGYDVYTRNLTQSLLTAKYFSSIQKATSAESLNLLSSIQTATRAITTQSSLLRDPTRYEAPKASSDALSLLSSKQPLTQPLDVKVNSIAKGQSNLSNAYNANGLSFLAGGLFNLNYKTGGSSKSIAVDLAGARTNKEVLGKVADAFNKTGAFKAELIQEKDQVQLKITGLNTGKDKGFTLEGDEAVTLGLDRKITDAQNGSVTVNGTTIEQDTNQYVLKDQGVSFDAKAVTEETVTIENKSNTELLSADFGKLSDSLNDLISTYENKGNLYLKNRLDKGFDLYRPELEKIGIRMEKSGIQIDSAQLEKSLNADPKAEELLKRIANISTNAVKNLNPTSLLKDQLQKTYDTSENTPFYLNNLGNIIDNNPYKGSLLDMLV